MGRSDNLRRVMLHRTSGRSGRRLDVLVCNAAIYRPNATEPEFTPDGFETRQTLLPV